MSDHIRALEASRHSVFVCDMRKNIPWFINLQDFDVIIIHYTLVMYLNSYLSSKLKEKIKNFKGLKACFIQDEYRFVNQTMNAMEYMEMHIVFTCVPPSEFSKLYAKYIEGIVCVNVLTGYVPEELLHIDVPDYSQQMVDVCYRGRNLPYWLGELGQEKNRIAEKFQADAKSFNLVTDIDFLEKKRLYGKKWIQFLSNSKACLGTESGASVFDFTGAIEKDVKIYMRKNPKASFEEVQNLFFKDLEGKIKLNQISPRCFEAAALKTLMILYEGEYSGILLPWKHYVPLKKDHSNMKEVVSVIQDSNLAEKIIACAYEEIALNKQFSYQALTNIFDEAIEEQFKKLSLEPQNFQSKNLKYSNEKLRLQRAATIIKYMHKILRKITFLFKKPVQLFLDGLPGFLDFIKRKMQ